MHSRAGGSHKPIVITFFGTVLGLLLVTCQMYLYGSQYLWGLQASITPENRVISTPLLGVLAALVLLVLLPWLTYFWFVVRLRTKWTTIVESKVKALVALGLTKDQALPARVRDHLAYHHGYALPLLILTLLALVGWYAIFFSNGVGGVAEVLLKRESFVGGYLTDLLSQLNPITTTFLVAWLVNTILLLIHSSRADLHPKDCLYASMRLLVALMVGLVSSWFSTGAEGNEFSPWYLLPAMVVAAPFELVRAGFQRIKDRIDQLDDSWYKDLLRNLTAPGWGGKHPLTKLDRIKLWDSTRLYVEGVQNVHALATVDLKRWILHTTVEAKDLADWVDRALLYIRVKEGWWQRFAALEKRGNGASQLRATATSLLESCVDRSSGKIDEEKLRRVVQEYNQGLSGHATGNNATEEPAQLALTTDILEVMLLAMVRGGNIAQVRLLRG